MPKQVDIFYYTRDWKLTAEVWTPKTKEMGIYWVSTKYSASEIPKEELSPFDWLGNM